MKDWMHALAEHYEDTRRRFPEDPLLILFDIDGTILDMRYLVLHVLAAFDREYGTAYFKDLDIGQLDFHENQILSFLESRGMAEGDLVQAAEWYEKNRWGDEAVSQSHRPYPGVLEVIRWFQIQPNTFVGLNTGRPEGLRQETLLCLNSLGREHRVDFRDDLLFMNPAKNWEGDILQAKVAGVRHFQAQGYRVLAFIDNEPANLKAVAEADPGENLLLLHADTLFESSLGHRPRRSLSGKEYKLTALLSEARLPHHVQLIWQGIHDETNLRQFLASRVRWGELDMQGVVPSDFHAWLSSLKAFDKGLLLNFHEGGLVLDKAIDILQDFKFPENRLAFKGELNRLTQEGIGLLKTAFPRAVLQCSVDFLMPMLAVAPKEAVKFLDRMKDWGIERFGLRWSSLQQGSAWERLEKWGYPMALEEVPDLEAFLKASLLLPASIASDFNFPQWCYYGRGAGLGKKVHLYETVVSS